MTVLRTRRLVAAVALVLVAGAIAGACGDDDVPAASDDVTTTSEAGAEPTDGALEVSGAWARTSPAVATAGAVYLEIANGTNTDDALVEASVDAGVAATVELHETAEADTDGGAMGGGDMGTDGSTSTSMGAPMMEMKPVEEIPVPAGETVALEPGGFHIMLLDLAEPLEVGDTLELTLTFAEAGDVAVAAEVRDLAP